MIDQTVIERWWAQLGEDERMGLLYHSNLPELKVAAGIVSRTASYLSLRKEIQEVIENAFLDGRGSHGGHWYGILWTFTCPFCNQESIEQGSIEFNSGAKELAEYLRAQSVACMNCKRTPPEGTNVHVEVFCAPLVVLREVGCAPPLADCPTSGTYYSEAWRKAQQESPDRLRSC